MTGQDSTTQHTEVKIKNQAQVQDQERPGYTKSDRTSIQCPTEDGPTQNSQMQYAGRYGVHQMSDIMWMIICADYEVEVTRFEQKTQQKLQG